MTLSSFRPLICLATLSACVTAFAQDEGGTTGGGMRSYVGARSAMMRPAMMSYMPSDLLSLLMQPHIFQELKISPEQQQSIHQIMMNRQKAQMEAGQAMQKLSQDLQQKFVPGQQPDPELMQKMQKLQNDFMETQQQVQNDADTAVFELLEKKQSQRLLQVQLQIALRNNGLTALAQEPLSELLTISEDQKRKLVDKQIETRKELDQMMEVLRDEMQHEALTDVLTTSQLEKLGEMKGDPLEGKRPDFYSQMLRRQVLGEEPGIGKRLLDAARGVVDEVKKELDDE